jgi:DNA-binding NtrC family response regulator
MNILVVDDEAVLLESIRIGLESNGHRVFEAHNAQEALDQLYFEGHRIDLVATDYLMPTMNGIDLLKEIRRSYPTLPVIIMTGYADKNMVIEALRNRCNSVIEKPFAPDELASEIERVKHHLTPKFFLT